MNTKRHMLACILGFLLASVFSAAAQTLLLDFGPTLVASPDVSPAHNNPAGYNSTGPLSTTTQISWTQVGTGGIIGSAVFADGSSASGITVVTGIETTAGSSQINFSSSATGSFAGSATAANFFAVGRVARDGIFTGTGSGTSNALGVRVDGLAAGTYDIYFMARNSNSATSQGWGQNLYAAAGSAAGTFNFGSLTATGVTNNTAINSSANFAQGVNYNVVSLTLSAGQSLFFATEGTHASEMRGFLNSLEIVSIPEPSAPALFAFGAALLFFLRRKNRPAL